MLYKYTKILDYLEYHFKFAKSKYSRRLGRLEYYAKIAKS